MSDQPRQGGLRWKDHVYGAAAVFGIALAARLAALPFAQTCDGDAVNRTYLAWYWLAHPTFIWHDIWPPLHTYLLALGLWVHPDPILTPPVVNALFAAGTAAAVYVYTRIEFDVRAGWLASCAVAIFPPAFRNSLMALSETPFLFFLAWSLVFVAAARRPAGHAGHAAAAGIALTLATALRYEGWLLVPVLPVLLWRKPRLAGVMVAVALLFPLFWMWSNYAYSETHDPLYGIHSQQVWESHLIEVSGGMTPRRRLLRAAFVPVTLLLGTTLLGAVSMWGAVRSLRCRRSYALWLLPLGVLLAAYTYKAATGSLAMEPRYTIVLAMLLAPFCAELFQSRRQPKPALLVALVAGTWLIPFSYRFVPRLVSPLVPGIEEKLAGLSTSKDMERILEAVPRRTKDADEICQTVAEAGYDPADQGLIQVRIDWQVAQQVCLFTRLYPTDRLLLPFGVTPQHDPQKQLDALADFLGTHRRGVLVVRQGKPLEDLIALTAKRLPPDTHFDKQLELEEFRKLSRTVVFRYRLQ